MEWNPLEPVRLHSPSPQPSSSNKKKRPQPPNPNAQLLGRLPLPLYALILSYSPVPDIPALARVCRKFGAEVKDGRHWEHRWQRLVGGAEGVDAILDNIEQGRETRIEQDKFTKGKSISKIPATLQVEEEDDFGDFSIAAVTPNSSSSFGGFIASSANGINSSQKQSAFTLLPPVTISSSSPSSGVPSSASSATIYRPKFIRAHTLLFSLLPSLQSPPHLILPTLFPPSHSSPPTLLFQAKALALLGRYLSRDIRPLRDEKLLYIRMGLRQAIDRFESICLGAFDRADAKRAEKVEESSDSNATKPISSAAREEEKRMREAAHASWEAYEDKYTPKGRSGWELGKVWVEKQGIFYESDRWDPASNFSESSTLAFDSMDAFITSILQSIYSLGGVAVRVFPPASGVLLSFADRLAGEVVSEYTITLLTRAREISNITFLQATAACFVQSFRMVDSLMEVAGNYHGEGEVISRTQAEDVVYKMFEQHMDEYLDEEAEWAKASFEGVCKDWNTKHAAQLSSATAAATRFLASQNPQQMKRTVLASFTSALLMPVTIVPKTMGVVGGAVGSLVSATAGGAVQGISMLNPNKWGGTAEREKVNGYAHAKSLNGDGLVGEVEVESALWNDDEEEKDTKSFGEDGYLRDEEVTAKMGNILLDGSMPRRTGSIASRSTLDPPSSISTRSVSPNPSTLSRTTSQTTVNTINRASQSQTSIESFDALLSLTVALELIHADRDALKRVETFAGYPGHYGHKVRETIEELFVLMLGALGEGHVVPGLTAATEQMQKYRPSEHTEEESNAVAPLLQFFELAHIGDMIQSMVQVFFDKEMAPHIDRTDFLNSVVREKKRFENALDDSVAGGLNAGTEVLMNQVEHIILTQTEARGYYPAEGAELELGPTKACREAIRCLEVHCKLLKGSTSKEVLEVFYQEVGIRLIAILQKHIKRQIISLEGGFQVIADLNAYHAFVSSLKVSTITSDFAHLKMLGHVYIVQDAKDLAQIVRDVTRYGGAYRPEDIYEFIQRRSDWKKIEKTVDKTMYNLSFKEDCTIM